MELQVEQIPASISIQKNNGLIPIQVQIGAEVLHIKPQYPETEMRLIQILIRALWEEIPQTQKMYLNNWTKGPNIGKSINPHQTIESLLEGSQQKIPIVRVTYENCKKFKVIVDVHDIIVLTYTEINIFHYMVDIIDCVTNDIKKQFKLDKKTVFKLNFQGEFKHARKMCFVGRYLDPKKTNHIKLLITFQQQLTRKFVQEHEKNYQQLICPISQLVMQQPVITICRHVFDKICISLAVMKDKKCPVCRKDLKLKDITSAKKLKSKINQLIKLQTQQRCRDRIKGQEQQGIE